MSRERANVCADATSEMVLNGTAARSVRGSVEPRMRGPLVAAFAGTFLLGALVGLAGAQRLETLGQAPAAGINPPTAVRQAAAEGEPFGGLPPRSSGRLIVRVKPSVGACLDRLAEAGRPMGGPTGSYEIDELNRRYGLRSVRPLRRAHAPLPTLGARHERDAVQVTRLRRGGLAMRRGRLLEKQAAFARTYVFEISPWLDLADVARDYERLDAVEYAEPDFEVGIATLTNDPFLQSSGTWGQPFEDLWGLLRVSALAAWDVTRGQGVVVAVIDTGVDFGHTDLAANAWTNAAEVPGNGIDDDANGYVDDVTGYDFVNDDPDPFDDHGHGTHVAGTIAAVGDNGQGIVGVAYESRVMALKGLDAGGSGGVAGLSDAILYAVESGARVINASWGCFCQSQTLDDAVEAAHSAGAVFVAAAGNASRDVANFSPANHVRAVAVAASDHNDDRAFFSNFGAKIDVAAPGGGGDGGSAYESWRSILSLRSSGAGQDMTGNGKLVVAGGFIRQAGTSMAAPHVAGAAALVLATHSGYSPEAVRQALRAGADDVGPPGVDPDSGYGRLNAAGAVAAEVLDVDILSPSPGTIETMGDVPVVGRATGGTFASYRVEVGAGEFPTQWQVIGGPSGVPVVDGELAVWRVGSFTDGPYVLRVVATNTLGQDFESRIPLTLDRLVLSEPEGFQMLRPSGTIELRGTASGPDFASYRLEWRVMLPSLEPGPWRGDGISPSGGSNSPIEQGLLGWFDPSVISENSDVDFRIVVTRGSGAEESEEVKRIIIDPTLRAGWPQRVGALTPEEIPDYRERISRHVVAADVDGDGTKEIVVAYGDLVHLFGHDGSELPGWPKQLSYPDGTAVFIRESPAIGDLDGDGLPEIVVAEGNISAEPPVERTHAFRADGSEIAGWPKVLIGCWDGVCDPGQGGEPPRGIVIADVDGDGTNELVIVAGRTLQVRNAQGELLEGWPRWFPEVDTSTCYYGAECMDSIVAVADMDGDGAAEIAAVSHVPSGGRRGQLLLYDSRGALKPRFPRPIPGVRYTRTSGWTMATADNAVHSEPVMADLDGDGDLEVVVQTTRSKLLAVHHDGRKARLRPGRVPKAKRTCIGNRPITMPPWIEPPVAGDLDGDGAAEIVAGVRRGRWKHTRRAWYLCDGLLSGPDYLQAFSGAPGASADGFPGWPVVFDYRNADITSALGTPAIADVDGDLVPEVVVGRGACVSRDTTYDVASLRCFTVTAIDRDGETLAGFPKATLGPTSNQSMSPAVADLDGDGLKEIVWIDFWGRLMVWTVPGTPAPEYGPWPMYRQNPALTGALASG